MAWWGWALIVLIAVMIITMSSSITFHLSYSRMADNDSLRLQFRALFGLLRYRYDVPVLKFKGLRQGLLVKKESINESSRDMVGQDAKQIDKDWVLEFYREAREMLQATFHMKDWLKDTMAHLSCTELEWSTRVGLGGAPETAVATGLVWTLKSSALTYVFRHIKRRTKPRLQVTPLYNRTHFSTRLNCIAQIRLGHAITAGLLLLIRILKVKGGIKAWQNILSKAS